MTVDQFEKKYSDIQMEANEVRAKVVPLLKELKKLGRKASSLSLAADLDRNLYVKDAKSGEEIEDGWNITALIRLSQLDLEDEITSIDTALYNIGKTKFRKGSAK